MRYREPRRELLKSMYIVRTLYPVYRMYEEWRASSALCPEAEFLKEIQTKVLRVFLLVIQSPLQLCLEISISSDSHNLSQFLLYTVKEKGGKPDRKPYPLTNGLRNPYRNLKSEKTQDYAQKPQRNCTFKNSASGVPPSSIAFNRCTRALLFGCAELCLTERDSVTRFVSSGFFHEPSSPSSGWSQKRHFKF
jgi:hypothetical protein